MILLLALIWLIGNQLSKVESADLNKVSVKSPFLLILGCVLVVANWFFEWRKWLITLKVIGVKEEQKIVFKSFMAGIATGLLTPNMLGNFLGRIYYFQRRFRVSIILMTLLSNFTQFFASIFFGFISLLLLQQLPFESSFFWVLILIGLISLISLVFYFFFEYITLGMIAKMKIYQKMLTFIDENKGFRGKFMMLSLIRHFVFTLQFWLIFNSFQDGINFTVFFWIWQIFLWTTLIPSLWFGKLLIRESVALLVLTSLGYAELEIVFSSVLLWIVNLAFPSILSIFICKRKTERV
jgi:hypothetical protein